MAAGKEEVMAKTGMRPGSGLNNAGRRPDGELGQALFAVLGIGLAGGIALVVLMVVNVICFVNVLKNKSIEPSIVRSLKFLQ